MRRIRFVLLTIICITLVSTQLGAMEPQETVEQSSSTPEYAQEILQTVEMLELVKQDPKQLSMLFYFLETLYEQHETNSIQIVQQSLTQTGISLVDLKDPCEQTVLSHACRTGNLDLIDIFLAIAGDEAKRLICLVSSSGHTVLSLVILLDHKECAVKLLAAAGDQAWNLIIKQNNAGDTPFHYATEKKLKDIVLAFLEKAPSRNAASDLIKLPNNKGETPWTLSGPNDEMILNKISEINRIFETYVTRNEMPYHPINPGEHYCYRNI